MIQFGESNIIKDYHYHSMENYRCTQKRIHTSEFAYVYIISIIYVFCISSLVYSVLFFLIQGSSIFSFFSQKQVL